MGQVLKRLPCRTGPLRAVRPLRGGYTGFGDAAEAVGLALLSGRISWPRLHWGWRVCDGA